MSFLVRLGTSAALAEYTPRAGELLIATDTFRAFYGTGTKKAGQRFTFMLHHVTTIEERNASDAIMGDIAEVKVDGEESGAWYILGGTDPTDSAQWGFLGNGKEPLELDDITAESIGLGNVKNYGISDEVVDVSEQYASSKAVFTVQEWAELNILTLFDAVDDLETLMTNTINDVATLNTELNDLTSEVGQVKISLADVTDEVSQIPRYRLEGLAPVGAYRGFQVRLGVNDLTVLGDPTSFIVGKYAGLETAVTMSADDIVIPINGDGTWYLVMRLGEDTKVNTLSVSTPGLYAELLLVDTVVDGDVILIELTVEGGVITGNSYTPRQDAALTPDSSLLGDWQPPVYNVWTHVTTGGKSIAVMTSDNRVYIGGEVVSLLLPDEPEGYLHPVEGLEVSQVFTPLSDSIWFNTADGDIYAVGENTTGELGVGNKDVQLLPVKVPDINGKIVKLLGMYKWTVLLMEDGNLYHTGGAYIDLDIRYGDLESFVLLATGVKDVAHSGTGISWLTEDGTLYFHGRSRTGIDMSGNENTNEYVSTVTGSGYEAIWGSQSALTLLDDTGKYYTVGINGSWIYDDIWDADKQSPDLLEILTDVVPETIQYHQTGMLYQNTAGRWLHTDIDYWLDNGFELELAPEITGSHQYLPTHCPDGSEVKYAWMGRRNVYILGESGDVFGYGNNQTGKLGVGLSDATFYVMEFLPLALSTTPAFTIE